MFAELQKTYKYYSSLIENSMHTAKIPWWRILKIFAWTLAKSISVLMIYLQNYMSVTSCPDHSSCHGDIDVQQITRRGCNSRTVPRLSRTFQANPGLSLLTNYKTWTLYRFFSKQTLLFGFTELADPENEKQLITGHFWQKSGLAKSRFLFYSIVVSKIF